MPARPRRRPLAVRPAVGIADCLADGCVSRAAVHQSDCTPDGGGRPCGRPPRRSPLRPPGSRPAVRLGTFDEPSARPSTRLSAPAVRYGHPPAVCRLTARRTASSIPRPSARPSTTRTASNLIPAPASPPPPPPTVLSTVLLPSSQWTAHHGPLGTLKSLQKLVEKVIPSNVLYADEFSQKGWNNNLVTSGTKNALVGVLAVLASVLN